MIYAEKNVFSMQKLSQLMQESPPNCCKYCDCIGTCIISDDILIGGNLFTNVNYTLQ